MKRHHHVRLERLVVAAVAVAALSSCSGTVQDAFGLSKRAPDEFQVVRRAPLVVPPEFRLPEPGSARSVAEVEGDALETRLTGAPREAARSSIENEVLVAAGGEVEPGIREKLIEENTVYTQLDESKFLYIFDWQRDPGTAPETIDPQAEQERLAAEGVAGRSNAGPPASERVRLERIDSQLVTPRTAPATPSTGSDT